MTVYLMLQDHEDYGRFRLLIRIRSAQVNVVREAFSNGIIFMQHLG